MDKSIFQERKAILEQGIREIQSIIQQNTAQLNAYIGALGEVTEWLAKCGSSDVKEGELLDKPAA